MGLSDQESDREMSIIIGSLTEKEILELLKGKFSTLKTAKLAARHPSLMKTKTFSALLKTKLPKISS